MRNGFLILIVISALVACILQFWNVDDGFPADGLYAPLTCELGTVKQEELILTVPVTNYREKPCRIIGMIQACGRNCCYNTDQAEPIRIVGGKTHDYRFTVTIQDNGPFQADIVLFIDDGVLREVTHTVRGVAAIQEKTDGNSKQ